MRVVFIILASLLAMQSVAHMQMSYPAPRWSTYSPYYVSVGQVDYSMANPLFTSGANFPCKGYAPGPVEGRVFRPGATIMASIAGGANHNGPLPLFYLFF
jgi:hypothetical protein